ncbi:hypothetical protein [Desulfogranum marinum]|uniref:hypothetical protein n=1 Tax=Desulfogranum marinum TaxID=453220 RepID=UPI0019632EC0|nr:hypothetical protein [Desulfogranum marinum]MBM9511137.1 hypothetical protein [Desulfogranum marinum]
MLQFEVFYREQALGIDCIAANAAILAWPEKGSNIVQLFWRTVFFCNKFSALYSLFAREEEMGATQVLRFGMVKEVWCILSCRDGDDSQVLRLSR